MNDNPNQPEDFREEVNKDSKRSSTKKEVVLIVDELKSREALGGKVKIDISILREMGLEPGDIVEIEGRKKTAGIVWPSYGEDDPRVIKVDPLVRRNADVSLGEKVIVRKAYAQPAKIIKIAPAQSHTTFSSIDQSFINYIKKRLDKHPVVEGDVIYIPILGQPISFVVVQTRPTGVVYISSETQIKVLEKPVQLSRITKVTYNDIGGMKDVILKVRELVELPLKYPEIFKKLGIDPPKGILLYGPPGVGKTLLAKAL
ncbi:MAG: AAA family ATPase, partial [Sulfolobales archaeon]